MKQDLRENGLLWKYCLKVNKVLNKLLQDLLLTEINVYHIIKVQKTVRIEWGCYYVGCQLYKFAREYENIYG